VVPQHLTKQQFNEEVVLSWFKSGSPQPGVLPEVNEWINKGLNLLIPQMTFD